ncbi:hypothetical protein VUR80DRAFT_9817 [Thermomyces stellatus]
MEVSYGTPVKSRASSPIASITPAATSREGTPDGAANAPFEGLGIETLRAVETSVKPEGTRILLRSADNKEDDLPGQPRIRLSPGSGDKDDLIEYLRESHLTTKLDELMPCMKYIFVQTPDYRHIYPLHHQAAHARQIIVDENPGLHLLWYYDRIFVKPIPAYFLSAAFWTYLRNADNEVYRAAVGFMRTYHYLIRYELDYDLACERRLIPRHSGKRGRHGDDHEEHRDDRERHPTYAEFCRFIEQFDRVPDSDVCRRYHYGELRLTRINRAAFLWKGKLAYFHIYPQWGSYLRHFFAPIVMILGGASVILSAMQVNLNAQEILDSGGPWMSFVKASLYFPVVTILLIAAVVSVSLLGALGMALNDLMRARRLRQDRRRGVRPAKSRTHGMI